MATRPRSPFWSWGTWSARSPERFPPRLAERHRARVQGADLPHFLNYPHGVVTLSAGVVASTPGETPEQVLRRADEALYEAKANGRNQTAVSELPDLPAVTARRRTPAASPAPS
jgi:CRISPR/Cas system-associated protein Cas10 (large subunit of type III CRISPR-Cas system)